MCFNVDVANLVNYFTKNNKNLIKIEKKALNLRVQSLFLIRFSSLGP